MAPSGTGITLAAPGIPTELSVLWQLTGPWLQRRTRQPFSSWDAWIWRLPLDKQGKSYIEEVLCTTTLCDLKNEINSDKKSAKKSLTGRHRVKDNIVYRCNYREWNYIPCYSSAGEGLHIPLTYLIKKLSAPAQDAKKLPWISSGKFFLQEYIEQRPSAGICALFTHFQNGLIIYSSSLPEKRSPSAKMPEIVKTNFQHESHPQKGKSTFKKFMHKKSVG